MIDIDEMRRLGRCTDSYSHELLRLHRWRAAQEIHARLLSDWMNENRSATSAEVADADFAASVVAEDRVRRMEEAA